MKQNYRLTIVALVAALLPALIYSQLELSSTSGNILLLLAPAVLLYGWVFSGKNGRKLLQTVATLGTFLLVETVLFMPLSQYAIPALGLDSGAVSGVLLLAAISFVAWLASGGLVLQYSPKTK